VAHKPPVATFRAWHHVRRGTSEGCVASRCLHVFLVAFVDLCIGVTKLDGDISFLLLLETNGGHSTQSLHDRRLSVSHVTNGTNVHCCLTTDDLGGERVKLGDIESLEVLEGKAVDLINFGIGGHDCE